ncbi:MAG: type II secretion system protein [Syntrophus sp. (in: bacteria)]
MYIAPKEMLRIMVTEEEKKMSCFREDGFTMMETIAVLLIIGIIAAVVVSRMGDTRAYDLASQLEVLKGHLRYAQSRAMSSSSYWGINFDSTTTYYLFQGVGSTTPVLLPGEDNTTVSMTAKSSDLTITPPTGGRITFDGYGSPCAASGTPPASLTADVTITTNGGNITVTKNTGFIP